MNKQQEGMAGSDVGNPYESPLPSLPEQIINTLNEKQATGTVTDASGNVIIEKQQFTLSARNSYVSDKNPYSEVEISLRYSGNTLETPAEWKGGGGDMGIFHSETTDENIRGVLGLHGFNIASLEIQRSPCVITLQNPPIRIELTLAPTTTERIMQAGSALVSKLFGRPKKEEREHSSG